MKDVLPEQFYAREDVVLIARELLGKVVCSLTGNGILTAGRIVETEAYAGVTDRASHAAGGRRTPRVEVMYGPPGHAYVYFIYGLFNMLNVVTNAPDVPHAVLIRALEPVLGMPDMCLRRNLPHAQPRLCNGPGILTQSLGITRADNGTSLQGPRLWIEDAPLVPPDSIIASPRVGVAYAGEDALLPYRFRISGSTWTSKAK